MPDAIWYPMRTIGIEDEPLNTRIIAHVIVVGLAQGVLAQSPTMIKTFTNPTPAVDDWFGYSVATVGNDRVLVGTFRDDRGGAETGAAYLFSSDGALLTTLTNPAPVVGDYFGISVAAVGSDNVLIGAPGVDMGAMTAGAAYLFTTAGTLVTTFANPTPAASDLFGSSVAAFGNDRVLVGAYLDKTGARDAGAAYLFATNGTLLVTFTNPAPAALDWFGISVASVGNDKILIGANRDDVGAVDAGAAYLFGTNGTLLVTLANPTPVVGDFFGYSVASVGKDRLFIGAHYADAGATDAGQAYLFSTEGALITTFTNPAPAVESVFGISGVSVGHDRVLIGAHGDDTGASDAGVAYLFNTNGTLLASIPNPMPEVASFFGYAVAATANDQVLVGAFGDSAGASGAGAAYLFAVSPTSPRLMISSDRFGRATISWVPDSPEFVLQETESLAPPDWTNSPSGAANPTDVPLAPPGKYFRLIKP